MLTLRRYFNFGDAALTKTLLDDYEISCSIFDEHSHRSVGLFWAVPVRVVVADGQFERAARILRYLENADPGEFAELEHAEQIAILDERIFGGRESERADSPVETGNPWEILAIAYLFFVPGLGFMLETRTLMLFINPWSINNRFLVLAPWEVHLVGLLLGCTALLLVAMYFYTRREIAHAERSG